MQIDDSKSKKTLQTSAVCRPLQPKEDVLNTFLDILSSKKINISNLFQFFIINRILLKEFFGQ